MKEITSTRIQHRRDFTADYKCEGCGHIQHLDSGYDDSNFHVNVIPQWECKECGESTVSLESEVVDNTRVPADMVL